MIDTANITNENDKQLDQFEADINQLATKYSLTRLKTESLNFDREFRRGEDTQLHLVSTKAVIRTLGKVTKVPIGETETYKTFETAYEATKARWSDYYKAIRHNRSPDQLRAEASRQYNYRKRRRQADDAFERLG